MPSFGNRSRKNLSTCHLDLQRLFNEVIKHFDCTIIVGYRNKENQDKVYNKKKSKLKYPQSKHNKLPSLAVDVVPYYKEKPHIRWNDTNRFYYFSGIVKGIATQMGIKIRFGGDWDNDTEVSDQSFNDLPHIELI